MTKPLLVGESNPYGADPYFALYPEPRGCAGWRLCHLVLGMRGWQYLEAFDRRNLLDRPRWSAPIARAAAAAIAEEDPARTIVLLGARVTAAFGLAFEPFTERDRFVVLPHPSGLCRLWNDPRAFDRARELVLRAAGRAA